MEGYVSELYTALLDMAGQADRAAIIRYAQEEIIARMRIVAACAFNERLRTARDSGLIPGVELHVGLCPQSVRSGLGINPPYGRTVDKIVVG